MPLVRFDPAGIRGRARISPAKNATARAEVARIGDDPARVGTDPEAGLHPAVVVEGHRHVAVADQDLLSRVLPVAVEVAPVGVIVAVEGLRAAPQADGREQSQSGRASEHGVRPPSHSRVRRVAPRPLAPARGIPGTTKRKLLADPAEGIRASIGRSPRSAVGSVANETPLRDPRARRRSPPAPDLVPRVADPPAHRYDLELVPRIRPQQALQRACSSPCSGGMRQVPDTSRGLQTACQITSKAWSRSMMAAQGSAPVPARVCRLSRCPPMTVAAWSVGVPSGVGLTFCTVR